MAKNELISGIPASQGIATGKIRILTKLSEIERVEHGDIIVVRFSNPTWTIALLKASGIIAESGGIICHAAIVAREMGIPCVVGVSGATTLFKDDQKVTIDGSKGVIYGAE